MGGHFFGQSSFASHALAHERNVVKLLDGMPLEIAGALGCGVQTGTGVCAARRVGAVANPHAIARRLKPVQEKATDCVAARRK